MTGMRRLFTCFWVILWPLCTTNGAQLEDLQDQLKVLTETFSKTAAEDKKMNMQREKILSASDLDARRKAFNTFKNELADLLEQQDQLLQQIKSASRLVKGSSFDRSPDLTKILQTFDVDLRNSERSLELLQAEALVLQKDQQFKKVGDVLAQNLKRMRTAFADLIEQRNAMLNTENGKVDKHQIVNFLEALKVTAITRQQTLLFEFAMTAQAAKISDYYGQLQEMYNQLLRGQSFASYMTNMGMNTLHTTNYIDELNDLLADETLQLPELLDNEAMSNAVVEIQALDELYPYEEGGVKYRYDPQKERWYCRIDGQRVYCPIDSEAMSGKFVRMHADGFFYSHAPWNETPRRLTFTKDWQNEIAEQ